MYHLKTIVIGVLCTNLAILGAPPHISLGSRGPEPWSTWPRSRDHRRPEVSQAGAVYGQDPAEGRDKELPKDSKDTARSSRNICIEPQATNIYIYIYYLDYIIYSIYIIWYKYDII